MARTRTALPLATALVFAGFAAGSAWAQPSSSISTPTTGAAQPGPAASQGSGSSITPPRPSELKPVSPLLGYGVLVVLGGAVVGLSIMPSKRSHQD